MTGGRSVSRGPAREHPPSSAGRKHLNRLTKWVAGIVAAALAGALTLQLTGLFDAIGSIVTGEDDRQETRAIGKDKQPKAPLTVAVEVLDVVCAGWVTKTPSTQIEAAKPPKMSTVRWSDWASAADGAMADISEVRLYVQGRSTNEVTITDIDVRVHQRRPPREGSYLQAIQCGGASTYRWLDVNLDEDPPPAVPQRAKEQEDWMSKVERKPIRFPYTVSNADSEAFSVIAHSKTCDCSWTVEISWASEGRTGTLVVDDNGRPFRTTSSASVDARCLLGRGYDESLPYGLHCWDTSARQPDWSKEHTPPD